MNIYDYSVKDGQGQDVLMKDYEGKVLLVVNTATGCGFTPQYEDIEKLYEEYNAKGFEVLDFPCNQFAGQAPGSDDEIHNFCQLNYNTQFPQMKKIEVNGEGADPLFKYLKSEKGFDGFGDGKSAQLLDDMLQKLDPDYKNNAEIKWNFTKFVVDRDGNVIARFEPSADMKDVQNCIASLI